MDGTIHNRNMIVGSNDTVGGDILDGNGVSDYLDGGTSDNGAFTRHLIFKNHIGGEKSFVCVWSGIILISMRNAIVFSSDTKSGDSDILRGDAQVARTQDDIELLSHILAIGNLNHTCRT